MYPNNVIFAIIKNEIFKEYSITLENVYDMVSYENIGPNFLILLTLILLKILKNIYR